MSSRAQLVLFGLAGARERTWFTIYAKDEGAGSIGKWWGARAGASGREGAVLLSYESTVLHSLSLYLKYSSPGSYQDWNLFVFSFKLNGVSSVRPSQSTGHSLGLFLGLLPNKRQTQHLSLYS